MAAIFTKANLMTDGSKFTAQTAAIRIATRILPLRRRDWAEAMLNEVAYIESRQAALRWMLGCISLAIKERVSFELERTFMSRRILRAALGLGVVSIIAVAGIYAIQKPYQRERISITLHQFFESHPTQTGK